MLRSLYRTLFTYAIFRNYFTTIFIALVGISTIIEVSFFYSDIFALTQRENPSVLIQILFALKWLLIFGFSIYFFYALFTFRPAKKSKKITHDDVAASKTTAEPAEQKLTPQTQAKLHRLLHKKKLQNRSEKILSKK